MTLLKPLKDFDGLSKNARSGISQKNEGDKQNYEGGAGNKLIEPVPSYIQTPSENVWKNDNNAWIVLGRDRPASRFSGYSGKGATGAGSIDIVAGRMAFDPKEESEDGEKLYVDPNFKTDAARIHVSQRTDIDENFDITEGEVGQSVGKSGVGVKGDAVRIVGREGIKIVTGTDSANSQGGDIASVQGIDLIAGNDDSDLQAIPKGDNVKDALKRLVEHQKTLAGLLENFLTAQISFNSAIATHEHKHVELPDKGPTAIQSPELASSGIVSNLTEMINSFISSGVQRINYEMFKMNYCEPVGAKYVKSRHNNTN